MRTKSRLILPLALISAALLAGCGSRGPTAGQPAKAVGGVDLVAVRLEQTPDLFEAVGTVRSATTSVLGAQISGAVREIRVREGERVRRGQVLAVLDDRTARAQLDAARAGVAEAAEGLAEVDQALQAALAERQFAAATYRRYQALLEKNSLSRQEFEGAEARFKAADANVRALEARKKQLEARNQQAHSQHESAETVYSYSRLVSPVDGVVTARSVDEGTLVMPGTPILTVEDTSRYRLEASLPEQFLPRVKVGQAVDVIVGGKPLEGKVAEVVPAADVATRTFLVNVELPRKCHCRSGQCGRALFPVGEQKRLVVPRRALVTHGQLEGLYVAKPDGAVEFRLVKAGKVSGDRREILSGVVEGERVAASQLERLRDGVRVEVR